jgi:hypothetical protein
MADSEIRHLEYVANQVLDADFTERGAGSATCFDLTYWAGRVRSTIEAHHLSPTQHTRLERLLRRLSAAQSNASGYRSHLSTLAG